MKRYYSKPATLHYADMTPVLFSSARIPPNQARLGLLSTLGFMPCRSPRDEVLKFAVSAGAAAYAPGVANGIVLVTLLWNCVYFHLG